MTPRYFYRDPLDGIYMSKHYGVQLYQEVLKKPCDVNFYHWNVTIGEVMGYGDETEWGYLYVRPDSEHILAPQVGDLCWWNMPFKGEKHGEALALATELLIIQGGCSSIIQRQGRAFMWPKKEV